MKQNKVVTDPQTADEQKQLPSQPAQTPKVKPELTEEAKQERAFLTGLLIKQTDNLAEEAAKRRKRIEEREIELCSGKTISIAQIKSIITAIRQAYDAVFPNNNPYYKEIYRLNGWSHLDPNEYIKPAIVGKWTIEMLYNRLGKDVFPALSALNPALPNGIRLHKCFQFLTDEGRKKLEDVRDETIKLMQRCQTWHEFRMLLCKECGVPYQQPLL